MSTKTTFDEQLNTGIEAIQQRNFAGALQVASALKTLDPESADAYHLAAIAFQYQEKWTESIVELDRAIRSAPYDSNLYNLRGFARMSTGDLPGAESDFKEAIGLEDMPQSHRHMVLLRILQNRSEEAIALLHERIRINPADAENLHLMGDLLSRIGQTAKAETWYTASRERSEA